MPGDLRFDGPAREIRGLRGGNDPSDSSRGRERPGALMDSLCRSALKMISRSALDLAARSPAIAPNQSGPSFRASFLPLAPFLYRRRARWNYEPTSVRCCDCGPRLIEGRSGMIYAKNSASRAGRFDARIGRSPIAF